MIVLVDNFPLWHQISSAYEYEEFKNTFRTQSELVPQHLNCVEQAQLMNSKLAIMPRGDFIEFAAIMAAAKRAFVEQCVQAIIEGTVHAVYLKFIEDIGKFGQSEIFSIYKNNPILKISLDANWGFVDAYPKELEKGFSQRAEKSKLLLAPLLKQGIILAYKELDAITDKSGTDWKKLADFRRQASHELLREEVIIGLEAAIKQANGH